MTPELAAVLATVRLRQTAHLLVWMAEHAREPGPLARAHEHVTEALRILDSPS